LSANVSRSILRRSRTRRPGAGSPPFLRRTRASRARRGTLAALALLWRATAGEELAELFAGEGAVAVGVGAVEQLIGIRTRAALSAAAASAALRGTVAVLRFIALRWRGPVPVGVVTVLLLIPLIAISVAIALARRMLLVVLVSAAAGVLRCGRRRVLLSAATTPTATTTGMCSAATASARLRQGNSRENREQDDKCDRRERAANHVSPCRCLTVRERYRKKVYCPMRI
jgi:hypothetical protein